MGNETGKGDAGEHKMSINLQRYWCTRACLYSLKHHPLTGCWWALYQNAYSLLSDLTIDFITFLKYLSALIVHFNFFFQQLQVVKIFIQLATKSRPINFH